jgi:hypothetical protein
VPLRSLRSAAVLAAALPLAGCGFLDALAHPDAAGQRASSATPAPVPAVATPVAPRVVGQAPLADVGTVTVTVGDPVPGLLPPVPNARNCPWTPTRLQYLPVSFTLTAASGAQLPGLAAHVTLHRGPATPADAGDTGVFVESGGALAEYCDGGTALPTTDRFWDQMGAPQITAYVVVEDAVDAAHPDGRPDVLASLQVEVSDFRVFADPERQRTVALQDPAVGTRCADDPAALCVALG